jgi:hypothetical protein
MDLPRSRPGGLLAVYREDFAFADTASLGSNWTLVEGSNQRVVSQAAEGNATSTSNGFYRYTAGKMPTDNMRLDIGIVTPPNGTLTNTAASFFIFVRMPDTYSTTGAAGTETAAQILGSGSWEIDTTVQITITSKVTGTLAGGFVPGDQISLTAIGTRYEILHNNVPVPSAIWIDTSNTVVSIGATKRNFGLLIQCAATNLQHPAIDWVTCVDLTGQFFFG